MASADLSKTEAIEKADRLQGTLARMRRRSKETVLRAQRLAGMAAGGAVSGYLSVKLPTIPGTNTDTGKVLGGGLALLAMSGFIDDEAVNEFVLGVSGGILAMEAGDAARAFALRPTNRAT